MFGTPRIGLKPLEALCRRLAMSLGAGVEVRSIWLREAANASGAGKRHFLKIRDAVAQGGSISEAMAGTGEYFPEFFREMVHVGEQTGHLPEVFRQLAEYYDQQLRLRRMLGSALAWPLLELGLAIGIIGLLIWAMGVIPNFNSDLLGFGLKGNSGLLIYLLIVGSIGGAIYFFVRSMMRGMLWTAPVQKALMAVPKVGKAFESLALARLTWAMHVTLNTSMDLRSALSMSLRSTQNVQYMQHTQEVLASIRAGREIHEAFAATGDFPMEFIAVVRVGEESGQLVEAMGRLSSQYQEEARSAMSTMAVLLGVAVAGLIAAIIIFMIFRIFGFYLGVINDAVKMRP